MRANLWAKAQLVMAEREEPHTNAQLTVVGSAGAPTEVVSVVAMRLMASCCSWRRLESRKPTHRDIFLLLKFFSILLSLLDNIVISSSFSSSLNSLSSFLIQLFS